MRRGWSRKLATSHASQTHANGLFRPGPGRAIKWRDRPANRHHQDRQQPCPARAGGGSNGSRLRLWKIELQKLADELGLAITVCHLPPGTSKWNKIEHRLFSFITQNWRGKPRSE